MSKVINSNEAPKAIGPYVQARMVGDMLYTSGQLPIAPKTGTMPDDIRAQTKQSLANVEAIISEAGLDKTNIIKTTVFVKDLNDFADMNEVYAEFFGETFPARSCFEVARLPMDAKVEIEVIATSK